MRMTVGSGGFREGADATLPNVTILRHPFLAKNFL